MWETVVPALSVLAAEAVIRRKINALPPETFPLRIGQRVHPTIICFYLRV